MQELFLFETLIPTFQTIRYDIILFIRSVMAFMFRCVRKLRKASISFVVSVRPVHMEQLNSDH